MALFELTTTLKKIKINPFIKDHDFEDHGQKMRSKNLYIDFKRVTMAFKSPVHHYIEAYLKTQKDLIFLKTRVPLPESLLPYKTRLWNPN